MFFGPQGYSNEDLARICGGNKMRVYAQVWEGKPPERFFTGIPRTPADEARVPEPVPPALVPVRSLNLRQGANTDLGHGDVHFLG